MASHKLLLPFLMCATINICEASTPRRSVMFWLTDGFVWPDKPLPASVWKERIANVSKHRANLTTISPCIHGITTSGTFGNQGQSNYKFIAPYLPQYRAMGLEILPIIYNVGGLGGLQRLLKKAGSEAFIKAAVDKAVAMDYAGYNMDNELRGKFDDASWAYLKGYGEPWIAFLNEFADALHAVNKTLSVDLEGCCGWVSPKEPAGPAGHCTAAFASHEFVGTTCSMYKNSRLDAVYAMGTYSDEVSNATNPPYGPKLLEEMASYSQAAIGQPKYSFGFKGGWTLKSFDETAKDTIRSLHRMGIHRISHWVNEPLTQASWDAWGYFLHGDGGDAEQEVIV